MTSAEPIFDIAQLAHVELLTPEPDRTVWFFEDPLGMQETTRQGQSVFPRAYEEFYHHSLKITEAVQGPEQARHQPGVLPLRERAGPDRGRTVRRRGISYCRS